MDGAPVNGAALAKGGVPAKAGAPAEGATPATDGHDPAAAQSTFTVPATAIFHKDNGPAVWVIEGSGSTLQLRPVKVSGYTDHKTVITSGLSDGEVVVLAGVHTVYAGEHVRAVSPLFDGEGDVDGPASAGAR
jgi:multidrug efflux pump subunit AcrA (membrane-fusion protein)